VSQGTVKEDWIDYNGHMNMAYYVQCFEESSDFLLEHMDLGYRYAMEEQKGVFVIKCEINYRKEINLHKNFIISLEELVFKGKKLIVGLKMLNENNETIADYKILNLNVDLETKKSSTFSPKIIAQLT
jgi:acyl-CoA thioester hydrolase